MKLYGKNPVLERLKTNPKSIHKIFIEEGHVEAAYIRKKAKKWNIPVFSVPRSKMLKMGQTHNTQGVLVEVEDFPYVEFDTLLENAVEKKRVLVFLDSLNDPQNLGAIIRSFACLGNFSLVLPKHDSVDITETVLRVASGGDNYIKVAKIQNLNNAIVKAKEAGFWVAGTVVKGGQTLWETKLPFPLGLVIGSEQKGIRDVIRKHLDIELTIPMAADRMSFNVAHAAAVFAYEIIRQQNERIKTD